MPQPTPKPVDPLEALLKRSPLMGTQRAELWDLYESSATADDLATALATSAIPRHVKSQLFILKSQETAPVPSELTQPPPASAMSRFASNMGEMIDPVTIAKGMAKVLSDPLAAATGILGQANEQRVKAHEAQDRGDYGEMAARSVAAAVPILGPQIAEIGEQVGAGDWAGAAGKATGIAVPLAVGAGIKARRAPNPVKADTFRRNAESTVSDRVLAPANPAYKVPAQRVAPEILKRGVQGDRVAIQQWADDLIGDAQHRIDTVIDSYPETATLKTKPVLDQLDAALDRMTFTGPKKGAINPLLKDSAASLRTMRDFVSERGAEMTFADMRRLRQQLDDVSAKAGAFSKAKGDLSLSAVEEAATETAHALRRQIAAERPELAIPHADMNLAITVRDILNPAKGRPKTPQVTTGATGGLHTTGAIIGAAASNIPIVKAIAAFVASDLIPRIRNAQVSPQHQLRLAKDMHALSASLAAGNVTTAQKAILNLSMYVPGVSGQIGRLSAEPAGMTK